MLTTLRSIGALFALACTQLASSNAASPPPSLLSAGALSGRQSTPTAADPTPAGLRALAVEGFQPALLFVPGGNEPRPLLVAAHGAGGAPEWDCEYWRRITAGRAFILCLRGTPLGPHVAGFYFADHRALERELVAAQAAARRAEPRIAHGPAVYAGFSQGATMGTPMIVAHAEEFPFLVLIESFEPWNVPRAKAFARAGGRRVLLVCGSKECQKLAASSAHWLSVAGVEVRAEYARGAGHTPLGPVMPLVEHGLSWLVGDQALWAATDEP